MTSDDVPVCVFCGKPILPGQPTAGRAPMAGHASCADAALADDDHWEAISAGSDGDADPALNSGAPSAARGGCLLGAVLTIVAGIALAGRVARGR